MIEGKGANDSTFSAADNAPLGRQHLPPEEDVAALRAENASLRARLALQEQALDSMPTLFLVVSVEGPEAKIAYCNRAVAEHHGLRREELLGKNAKGLSRGIGHDSTNSSSDIAELRAGKVLHLDSEVTRPDGSKFWLGLSTGPLFDRTGAMTHCVTLGADITAKREEMRKKQELQDKLVAEMRERERMTVELQLAQKLESVGRLAAGVAHEINSPIQYIGDGVYFLRSAYEDISKMFDGWRRAVEELSDGDVQRRLQDRIAELMVKFDMEFLRVEIPKALERTLDGVDRVTNIVKAMKEFAHPDANAHSPADLNHALKTTLLVASNEYKYIAKIHTEFAELPEVKCNIGELNQVFLNLIINAAHAIQDAHKDSTTGQIKISTAVDGDTAVIRIEDNGCGISAENLAKVYDPFFTTKEVGRGSGQGLAITHSILVDKHGGDIKISSQVGVGTEFTLRLPIAGRAAVMAL